MHRVRVLPFLFASVLLQAQAWRPWSSRPRLATDAKGFSCMQGLAWKDSDGRRWRLRVHQGALQVTGPDGSSTWDHTLDPDAFEPEGLSTFHLSRQWWCHSAWEGFRLRLNTGRCGIDLSSYVTLVIHRGTGHWALVGQRVSDGTDEGPRAVGTTLTLRWCDESETRPLRIHRRWTADASPEGLKILDAPPLYQLESGYPFWFRFWADVRDTDPNRAERNGWRSVAWRLSAPSLRGGHATSERRAIPKVPGKQVWRKGTGPDVWFPVPGRVGFRWDDEVDVFQGTHPPRRMKGPAAGLLAKQGEWGVVLKRQGDGSFLGTVLVEGGLEPSPGEPEDQAPS